jgi:hypothetical protein
MASTIATPTTCKGSKNKCFAFTTIRKMKHELVIMRKEPQRVMLGGAPPFNITATGTGFLGLLEAPLMVRMLLK